MKLEQKYFQQRRDRLAALMGPNSVAIIATSPVYMRNRDADFKFRADSSFYYLTGFAEPEAVAVIETDDSGEAYNYILFCRERDRDMEIWNGLRAGTAGAIDHFAADEAYAIEQLDGEIQAILANKQQLYYRIAQDSAFDTRVMSWLQKLGQSRTQTAPSSVKQLDELLDEMRLIKSSAEIELMQHAADLSAAAHLHAMQVVHPGMMEYALEAEFNYLFAKQHCVPAYNSIVAGGENACILHYVENDQALKSGDLVLIDAGCEYQYYAGDISRTFPVNGVFSPEQKALYQLVLDAQYAAIEAVQVGHHFKAPHFAALEVLVAGLVELGILHGEPAALIESGAYQAFYMHGTSHWLGMDVHDVGRYQIDGEPRALEAGMVLTIEPGLYIAADESSVAQKWRGIGIRIEDDVLVTKNGPQVLTSGVAKEIDAIEALMAKAKR